MNTRPKLYSQRAAAKFVGISLSTFRKYASIGVVRGTVVEGGGTMIYAERDLIVFRGYINFPTRRFKRLFYPTIPIIGWHSTSVTK
jgi:hypothetical protein